MTTQTVKVRRKPIASKVMLDCPACKETSAQTLFDVVVECGKTKIAGIAFLCPCCDEPILINAVYLGVTRPH